MKSSSKILILAIFLVFICCVSAASAAENDNVTASGDELALEEVAADDVIDEQDTLASQEVSVDEKLAEDSPSEYVVWVGTNSTPNGQGTENDPFPTLDSACAAANNGGFKSKVTVNIKEGNYTIGSELKFNTSNLHINALDSKVVIKNLYDTASSKQSFGLIEQNNGNFTMSNVIFDASGWSQTTSGSCYFTPFNNGNNNIVKFNNCTFTGFDSTGNQQLTILPYSTSSKNKNNVYEFNECKFINYTSSASRGMGLARDSNLTFVNCVFSARYTVGIGMTRANGVIFDSCWFGLNDIENNDMFYSHEGRIAYDIMNIAKFTRHAIFTISENYLGDNKYEIIGKLIWNDTTDDNIDKLGPMTVYLSANNGNIPETATLENGMFKVNYTTESPSHEITARLDQQTIKLNNCINFDLNSPCINYGGNQNITVTFKNNVNGTVYVTVNNKTYREYCDDKNVTVVSIKDNLPKGTYDVSVKFESETQEISKEEDYTLVYDYDLISFGFNSTTISILGIQSSLTVSPITTTYNVTEELVATLTDINSNVLVNKPVHIVVGTIDKTLNTTSDGQVSVDVSNLVPGSYVATISFAGDECYEEFSTATNVIINKVTPNVNISREGDLVPGEKLIIKVEVPYATENVTIIVNGDKNTTKLVDNAATYTIGELAQGTYYVTVLYAGDELCDFAYATDSFDVVKSTADLINELNSTIASQASEIGNLSATVVAQNATIEAQQKQITDLKKTSGKDVVSKKVTKITAPKKTFKAKTKTKKIKVKLTTGKTALKNKKITLKIKGKTYTATTNKKGIATFKITKLTKKGTFKYTVKFAGDKAYKAVSKNGKITIK